jgi:putative ABC transport system permease protein
VESVAFSHAQPTDYGLTLPYEFPGAPPVDAQRRPTLSALIVSPGYFRTLGAAVRSGREFTDSDDASGIPVVIVNQRFATTFWPGEDPLAKRLRLFDGATPDAWLTVVGVASNIVQNDPTGQRTDPLIYLPYRQKQRRGGMLAIARTRVPPGSLGTAFRREIQALDSDVPFVGLSTLAERLERNYRSNRFFGVLLSIFAAMALLIASVGLSAVIGHSVSRRTQEIGIRTAMGATAGDILTLVFRQGMHPVGIGLIIGLVAALAVTPLLRSQLVQVSPADPFTYASATAVLVFSAALGCWIPARRATRVDPVVALRSE